MSNINRHFERYHDDIYTDINGPTVVPTATEELPPLDLENAVNKIITWIITNDQVCMAFILCHVLTRYRH
jgi:hypothetical protein